MPTLVSHIPGLVLAEMDPDGVRPRADLEPHLDLDLDVQDVELHERESELDIAVPGRW